MGSVLEPPARRCTHEADAARDRPFTAGVASVRPDRRLGERQQGHAGQRHGEGGAQRAARHALGDRPQEHAPARRERDPGARQRRGPAVQRGHHARRGPGARDGRHEGGPERSDEAGGRQPAVGGGPARQSASSDRHPRSREGRSRRVNQPAGHPRPRRQPQRGDSLGLLDPRPHGDAGGKTGVSHAAITPDGKMALVSRDGDDRISVLSIEGTKVEHTKRDLNAGLRPYGVDISSKGDIAVVANIGRGQGDADTASLIDLRANPPRVVDTITVGQTPEGIKLSPDGSLVAIIAMNGSNKPRQSPFFNDHGNLVLLRVSGGKLSKVAEAPIGHWSQGAAFSPDGRTILVGNMVEKEVWVFEWDGSALKQTAKLKVNGGSAAVRIADK